MTTTEFDFYFDYISPYAYLAWPRVQDLADRRGCALRIRPIVFAALLNHYGQLGPAEIPAKRLFTFKDVFRRAAQLQTPLSLPRSHPFNPLAALRASLVGNAAGHQRAVIDALYSAVWSQARSVQTVGDVATILSDAGLDGEALTAAVGSPDNKAELRSNTDAAIAAGVFGVPTVVVDGEPFWGHDRLDDVERFLDGEDPARDLKLGQMPATASRR